MTAGPAARTARDRLLAGDGLRAVAALSVLTYHSAATVTRYRYGGSYAPAFGSVPSRVLETISAGLFIFFALSGYLVARPFVRALVLGTHSPSLRRYALSRTLRIIPAFWLAVTLTLVLLGTAGTGLLRIAAIYAFGQVFAVSGAAAQISQAWTLDAEMCFYLVLPVAAVLVARRASRGQSPSHRARTILAGLAVVTVATGAWVVATNPLSFETLPPQMLFAFAPGVALATVEPLVAHTIAPGWARRVVPLLLTASLALFVVCCATSQPSVGVREVLEMLAAGAVIGAALIRQWSTGSAWRLIDNRVMNWIGERSYGVYVLHMLVLTEIHRLAFRTGSAWGGFALITVAALALSLAAAAASWRFVEAPALRLRTRLAQRQANAVAIPGSPVSA